MVAMLPLVVCYSQTKRVLSPHDTTYGMRHRLNSLTLRRASSTLTSHASTHQRIGKMPSSAQVSVTKVMLRYQEVAKTQLTSSLADTKRQKVTILAQTSLVQTSEVM